MTVTEVYVTTCGRCEYSTDHEKFSQAEASRKRHLEAVGHWTAIHDGTAVGEHTVRVGKKIL